MSARRDLAQRLSVAEATIEALLSGQIDAVVDPRSQTPVLLSKAQDALRQSEERYRQIVEATTDGILKIDDVAQISFVNRRFAELLGYEAGEMVGRSVFSFMSAAARLMAAQSLQSRRVGAKDAVDTTFRHKDGTDIAVNVGSTVLIDGEGGYAGNLAVVRDVTERKKLLSQLMVSDRMASVGTMAAGVAHEINNPLAAVIANLDYLTEALSESAGGVSALFGPRKSDARVLEELKAPLEEARVAADRMRFIVHDLTIFSRSPSDEPRGSVDVEAIMESSLRMARNEIRHRARLVKHFGAVPWVEANEARLGQVFLNLIVNASQSLQEGRAEQNEITVTTRLEGARVLVEVSDTGAGIPPEIIDRIFDAFFTTKAVGVGTGLGLAICQRIVTDMGGQLSVESQVGKGTTFRVALPVAAEKSAVVPPVKLVPVACRRGRILVVDDEKLVGRGVKRLLANDHEVVVLEAAKEALALCAGSEPFDLILCDLMMPDMTGMDLYRELLRICPAQARRMIFMTGGAFTEKARQFLAETPQDHFEKPFDPTNLRLIVQRFLS